MKRNVIFTLSLLIAAGGSYAQGTGYPGNLETLKENICPELSGCSAGYSHNQNRIIKRAKLHKEITLTVAGTLKEALGDELMMIDSLVVKGPINDDDFYTMRYASVAGKLTKLNLENAIVNNNAIPPRAFCHVDEDGYIHPVILTEIILPKNTVTIGISAFGFALDLESITLPETLRVIGDRCFQACPSLKTSPLRIPEGVTEIPANCFYDCDSLNEVILPSTIKTIGECAFMNSGLR